MLGGLWLAMIIWGGRQGRMAAVVLVLAVALSDQLSCSLIKPLVGRLRPCNALLAEQCRLLVGRSLAISFPSAHAANSFSMATVPSWRSNRFAPLLFLFAAVVAYSRVYVGVHYPFDTIAGAILGRLIGRFAIWVVVRRRGGGGTGGGRSVAWTRTRRRRVALLRPAGNAHKNEDARRALPPGAPSSRQTPACVLYSRPRPSRSRSLPPKAPDASGWSRGS